MNKRGEIKSVIWIGNFKNTLIKLGDHFFFFFLFSMISFLNLFIFN